MVQSGGNGSCHASVLPGFGMACVCGATMQSEARFGAWSGSVGAMEFDGMGRETLRRTPKIRDSNIDILSVSCIFQKMLANTRLTSLESAFFPLANQGAECF